MSIEVTKMWLRAVQFYHRPITKHFPVIKTWWCLQHNYFAFTNDINKCWETIETQIYSYPFLSTTKSIRTISLTTLTKYSSQRLKVLGQNVVTFNLLSPLMNYQSCGAPPLSLTSRPSPPFRLHSDHQTCSDHPGMSMFGNESVLCKKPKSLKLEAVTHSFLRKYATLPALNAESNAL